MNIPETEGRHDQHRAAGAASRGKVKRAFSDKEEAARQKAIGWLRRGTPAAAAALVKIILDPNSTNMDRISAARVIFDKGGVPTLTQQEFVGNQITPTLIIVRREDQVVEAKESEQPTVQ